MKSPRRYIPDNAANLALGATLIVLAIIGILSFQTTQRFLKNDAMVEHTHQVVETLQLVMSDLKDAETGQRGYLLTGDAQYLQPYYSGSQAVGQDMDKVRALTRDNPSQQKRLDLLQPIVQEKLAELKQTIDLRRNGSSQAALSIVETGHGKDLMDQARLIVSDMRGEEYRLLTLRTRNAEAAGRDAQRGVLLGFLLGVVLVGISAIFVLRYITERKQAEKKTLAQLERLDLLHQITRAMGERQDLRSIFQVLIRSLEDSLPVDFCCVCTYDQPGYSLKVVHVGVKSEALAMELVMTEQAVIPIDENGLSRCVRGQLVYEPDITQIQFPFPQRLARGGLRSLVIAPLLVESKVFGVLVSARRQSNNFVSGECEFLKQLSEHVALAAHQADLYNALQQAYDDLRQTQQAVMQQERLRALGQMASGIAHDINNAMSPVALYTESLLESEPNLSTRARDYLETIQRAVGDVAQTVARMREFYRHREPQLALTTVYLNEIVQQVLNLTRVRWSDMPQQNGIVVKMQTDLAQDLPPIMGAESEIREALTNLIFNAVDAMPEGGTLTLRTSVSKGSPGLSNGAAGGHICVEVGDTGVGMDEDTRRRCLEPFFTTKGERGTGLGLAMVYGVAQRHSAEIEIEGAPGKGTRVRLSFSVPIAEIVQTDGPQEAYTMPSRMRILVVDDDPLLLKSLCDTLEADGHVVTTANGGQAGIDAFRAARSHKEPFGIVITDLGMPYIDGRKVASAIKDTSSNTPVILLTGWGQRLQEENDVPAHVDRVLSKPPKLVELREALARCSRPRENKDAA